MKYGKHTDLVEAFLAHLKSGNVDWNAARATAWDNWGAALDDARKAVGVVGDWDALDAARDAIWKAALAESSNWLVAGQAAYEIIGHEILAEQNKPLVFLPMFGIESIEQLKEMVKCST